MKGHQHLEWGNRLLVNLSHVLELVPQLALPYFIGFSLVQADAHSGLSMTLALANAGLNQLSVKLETFQKIMVLFTEERSKLL